MRELDAVHGKRTLHENVTVQSETSLEGIKGRVADLTVTVQTGEYRSFTLKLAADADHHTSLTYDPYTALDAFQRNFTLHRHIFVEGALTVDGIQLPHGGLNNASVLDMQLAGTDGLPEPLAALGLILGVRPCLQPCGHDAAAIRGKGGLGGVEVDAAVHQLQTWSDTEDKPQGCKWFGQTICPRELHIKDGRILKTPVRELDAVHGKRTFHENVTMQSETSLEGIKGRLADLTVTVQPGEYRSFP